MPEPSSLGEILWWVVSELKGPANALARAHVEGMAEYHVDTPLILVPKEEWDRLKRIDARMSTYLKPQVLRPAPKPRKKATKKGRRK